MTVTDTRVNLMIESSGVAESDAREECCGSRERPEAAGNGTLPGFAEAIAMAEAAVNHNPTWWNEIRTHSPDATVGEYCSSVLLGALLQSSAHRLGVPTADVWSYIRRTGELPL